MRNFEKNFLDGLVGEVRASEFDSVKDFDRFIARFDYLYEERKRNNWLKGVQFRLSGSEEERARVFDEISDDYKNFFMLANLFLDLNYNGYAKPITRLREKDRDGFIDKLDELHIIRDFARLDYADFLRLAGELEESDSLFRGVNVTHNSVARNGALNDSKNYLYSKLDLDKASLALLMANYDSASGYYDSSLEKLGNVGVDVGPDFLGDTYGPAKENFSPSLKQRIKKNESRYRFLSHVGMLDVSVGRSILGMMTGKRYMNPDMEAYDDKVDATKQDMLMNLDPDEALRCNMDMSLARGLEETLRGNYDFAGSIFSQVSFLAKRHIDDPSYLSAMKIYSAFLDSFSGNGERFNKNGQGDIKNFDPPVINTKDKPILHYLKSA